MGQLFQYEGRAYGSTPTIPLIQGSTVLLVFKSVGLVREGIRYVKNIGVIKRIVRPRTTEHDWWTINHTPDYVCPKNKDIIIVVEFKSGEEEIFLSQDMVNVCWLPTDTLPDSSELQMFKNST